MFLFSNVTSKCQPQKRQGHIGCIFLLFNTVRYQMSPQMVCIRGCIITLVASVWLLSTVCFQMSPQMSCLRGCIVTLVAFVWLFSTVCFQMSPQMACPRGGIFTLVACICEPSYHQDIVCHDQYPSLPWIWCVFLCCFNPTDSKKGKLNCHNILSWHP